MKTQPQLISDTLSLIKDQIGLDLKLCPHFHGVLTHNGRNYFNAILEKRTSESQSFDLLKRFADKFNLISIEPNGLNRVSIFVN